MSERTVEMETAAVLRRLKRLGVREVEWAQTVDAGGVVLRARVQNGRAHVALETTPHPNQLSALEELAALVADATRGDRRRRRQPTARPVQRPEAGVVPDGVEVDDEPLGTVEAVMARRDAERPQRPQREREQKRPGPDRIAARLAEAAAARPASAARPQRQDRPGRGGGR